MRSGGAWLQWLGGRGPGHDELPGGRDRRGRASPAAANPRLAIEAMMEMVVLDRADRVHAVIQGLEAAVVWCMTARIGPGEPFEVTTAQFWTFTPEGKVAAVLEFADTATILSAVVSWSERPPS